MAPLLSPPDALEYLAQMSADVRGGVVLDAAGELLAGDDALAGAARDLLAATGAAEIEVTQAGGIVLAARSATHSVVVVCGEHALSGLHRHDLRGVLGDLVERAA